MFVYLCMPVCLGVLILADEQDVLMHSVTGSHVGDAVSVLPSPVWSRSA